MNLNEIHCDVCFFKGSNEEEMLIHFQTGHIGISIICGECGKLFDKKEECKLHMESHQNSYLNIDPVLMYSCDVCNLIFLEKGILENHKTDIHKDNSKAKTLEETSDYEKLKVKIDLALNSLQENIGLNEKFDSSLDMLNMIINSQSEVILQLEEKIKVLSNKVEGKEQQVPEQQQHVRQ